MGFFSKITGDFHWNISFLFVCFFFFFRTGWLQYKYKVPTHAQIKSSALYLLLSLHEMTHLMGSTWNNILAFILDMNSAVVWKELRVNSFAELSEKPPTTQKPLLQKHNQETIVCNAQYAATCLHQSLLMSCIFFWNTYTAPPFFSICHKSLTWLQGC